MKMAVQQPIDAQTQLLAQKMPTGQKDYAGLAYAAADPNVRPFMRASTRWDYLCEYAGFWIDHYRFLGTAIALAAVGVYMLGVLWPVGLFIIALAGKYKNVSWWDRFIYRDFGQYRSLILGN